MNRSNHHQIGEVARIVHYIRKHLLNRTIKTCTAHEDDIVYGKVGTSASAFAKATQNRRVTGAAQQGKYFYITFDKPPHAVLHLGMTGWMKFDVEDTAYYKQAKETEAKEQEWPPRFVKFLWRCEAETVDGVAKEAVEVAFVDARRLARIRLVDCDADEIRKASPLKENGPDPVRDKDVVTVEWLTELMGRKKVPIKALLLDQANISGVGNWVADEVLYQARIHPEQYCNTFGDEQIKKLYHSLIGVCTIAVETLSDSKQFPEDWIMKYRWDKGKKSANILPNGEKITHLTVGGRTSAIVPSLQKKTGAVAADVDAKDLEGAGEDEKPAKSRKRKAKKQKDESEDSEVEEKPANKGAGKKAANDEVEVEKRPAKRARGKKQVKPNGVKKERDTEAQVNGGAEQQEMKVKASRRRTTTPKKAAKPPTPASRRSSRVKS